MYTDEKSDSKLPQKYLVGVFVLSCMVIVLLSSSVFLSTLVRLDRTSRGIDTSRKVCTTKECVELSAYIMDKMDFSVDPCENMYLYSCGSYRTPNSIPAGLGTVSQMNMKFKAEVMKLILSPDDTLFGRKSKALAKMKLYYNICTDGETIKQNMKSDILKLIHDLGSWTLMDDDAPQFDPSSWDMQTVLLKMHKMAVWSFFKVDVKRIKGHGLPTTTRKLIYLKLNEFFKEEAFYNEEYTADKFNKMVVGLGGNLLIVKEKMQLVANLTLELANAQAARSPDSLPAHPSQVFLLKTFRDKPDAWLNIPAYLKEMFGGIVFPDDVLLFFQEGLFLTDLDAIVKKYGKEVLANYMMSQVLRSFESILPPQGRSGRPQPRDELCLGKMVELFGTAVAALYVERVFKHDNKETIITLARDIKKQIVDSINGSTWLEEPIRNRLTTKAEEVEYFIGYPDWILNATTIDRYYADFTVMDGQFVQATVSAMRGTIKNSFTEELRETHITTNSSHLTHPLFDSSQNTVFISVNTLQPPMFGANFPSPFIYGGLGHILGHEMTHPFDFNLRALDEMSFPMDIWTSQSDEEYLRRVLCLANQYYSKTYYGQRLYANKTVIEDMCDNHGVKLAYRAFKSREVVGEPILPGLNLTDDQLFFLSYSQGLCETSSGPGNEKFKMALSAHSSAPFRVNVTLSNSDDFARAFNCPVGSPMNPEKKCAVWE